MTNKTTKPGNPDIPIDRVRVTIERPAGMVWFEADLPELDEDVLTFRNVAMQGKATFNVQGLAKLYLDMSVPQKD